MSDPVLVFGVGATKAGTSWLYRYLHDHPDCGLPAMKEAHYWDTFDPAVCTAQVRAFRQRRAGMADRRLAAGAAGRDWQVENLTRQMAAMDGLIAAMQGDRAGHAEYLDWMRAAAGQAKLTADLTPSYGLLPKDRLAEMARVMPATRFIYLIRDPIERLWSHVRMQAKRTLTKGENYATKANMVLARVLAGEHDHITLRGDYAAAITRLRDAIPAGDLLIEFAEALFSEEGLRRLTDFLGISYVPGPEKRIHEGEPVEMRADLRRQVAHFLQDQYDGVARLMGPLPQAWQDNQARALA